MAHLSVDTTLGAAFIGFSISCVIFGVLTTQVFVFYQRFPLDRWAYKLLVAGLWLLELVDQIFISYSVYFYVVTNYSNPIVLVEGSIVWTLILQIVMGSAVGTIVKCCFAMRVWRFSKHNYYITGAIVVMITAQFGIAILYCIRAFQLSNLLDLHEIRLVASLALGAGFLTDFLIAAALGYFLQKMRTGHRGADTLVNKLTIYAFNTGALTGAISLLTLTLYNAYPNTFYNMAVYFNLGKLYAISFLCALNTRKVLRGKGTDQEGNTSNSNTSNLQNTFFMVTNGGRVPRSLDYNNTNSQLKSVEVGIRQEVSVIADVESAYYHASAIQIKRP